MLAFLRERARVWQVVVALGVFALGSFALLAVGPYAAFLKETGSFSLETVFGYSPAEALRHLDDLGEAGRGQYAWWLKWDLLYPFLYALPLAFTLSVAAWRTTRREWLFRAALIIPLAAGVTDWIEDGLLLTLIAQHPDGSMTVATGAAVATAVKTILVWTSMAALVPALIAWAIAARR